MKKNIILLASFNRFTFNTIYCKFGDGSLFGPPCILASSDRKLYFCSWAGQCCASSSISAE